jgi:hypothetical protein
MEPISCTCYLAPSELLQSELRDSDYEADPVIILTLDSSNAFNSPTHEQFVSVLSEGRKIALPQDS